MKRALKTLLVGNLLIALLVACIVGVWALRVKVDARLPLDAFVTALTTDFAYDHLPNLDTPATEDYFTGEEPNSKYWDVGSNSNWLQRRVIQMVPYYQDNGLVPISTYPKVVIFMPQKEFDAFHLGGFSICQLEIIVLNTNYIDPNSYWSRNSGMLGTLAHELVHNEGDCGDSPDVEPTAQVGMMEILSSMINHGDKTAIRPWMYEMRGLSMGYLKWWAAKNDILPEYDWFEQNIIRNGMEEQAEMFGYQTDLPADWNKTMNLYNMQPFYYIWEGLNQYGGSTRYLPFRIDGSTVMNTRPTSVLESIKLDDTAYIFSHLLQVYLMGLTR